MFINYILLSSLLSKNKTLRLNWLYFYAVQNNFSTSWASWAPVVCLLQFLISNSLRCLPYTLLFIKLIHLLLIDFYKFFSLLWHQKTPQSFFWILGFTSKTLVFLIFIHIFIHRVVSFFIKFPVHFIKFVYIGITCHSTLTFFVAIYKEFFYFFMDWLIWYIIDHKYTW